MMDSNSTTKEHASSHRRSLIEWARAHTDQVWWLHSAYALLLGVGFMWLGSRNFTYLRVAVFHISFIWLTSLLLPRLLIHPLVRSRWAPRIKLIINFFNKNLYQQMLFFVLPIYYASATPGSVNFAFVILVGLSAILSTLDIVYDRHVSVKRGLTAAFFAFNFFALINVMLPILWSVSNTATTRISALLAFLGFLTLRYPSSPSSLRRAAIVSATGFAILGAVEIGRPMIPPVPLRLASVAFGRDFDREAMQVLSPVTALSTGDSLPLYGLTAVKAPLGLREKLRHRWYQDGKLICASPFYNIVGGREEGFRLWTSCTFNAIRRDTELRLDLETEGGQFIGRARLTAAN